MSRSPFLCLALSFVGPSPKPGIASRDAPSGRDRAATFSNLVPALRKPLSFGPSHRLPTTARVFPASALLRSLSFHSYPPPPFFPLCTDGSFLASGGRWPRPSPRTGHCSPLLRKWNPSPRRRRRAREGVCGRRWSWLQPRRSRDRCGCRYRSPAGSEAPWTSVARGEGGFRPPSHLEGC